MSEIDRQRLDRIDYSQVCRSCLIEACNMKNMHEWGLAEDFYSFTNIPMDNSNELSQWLCVPCEEMLATSRKFRVQCQRSDRFLREEVEKSKKHLADSLVNRQNNNEDDIEIKSQLDNNILKITIIASNTEKKIFLPCPYCDFKTIKKDHLSRHLAHEHIGCITLNLYYQCPYKACDFALNNKKNKHFLSRKFLNQHLFKKHRGKNFSCANCGSGFSRQTDLNRHSFECSVTFMCGVCNISYKNNETLLVHLLRKHPDIHEQYKSERKALKSQLKAEVPNLGEIKKAKMAGECDSPKRSFATQTFCDSSNNIRNDITLPSWHTKNSDDERNFNNTETQTVFEDLISLKSQNSDDSIFFSETVSLSDFSTQTSEFGLSRKETITSQTQTKPTRGLSPDFTKQTQTCVCLSPKLNFKYDSVFSSPNNLTSTETQTVRDDIFKSDVFSIETQTNFDDFLNDSI